MDHRKLAASLAASLMTASSAMAASIASAPPARIASDYSAWAGGRQNAEALVHGLHDGHSIMLSTVRADRSVSLAGFTPGRAMEYDDIASALAAARASLARLGIRHPSAEQIQAALIGGEVDLPNGRTGALRGTVGLASAPRVAVR